GGGGIVSASGTVTMFGCTITGNTGGAGGVLVELGSFTATNCTISGNSAVKDGGGIYNDDTAPTATKLYNTTVSGNSAGNSGAQIYGTVILPVPTLADETDAGDGLISLREAITFANSYGGTEDITFDPSLFSGGPGTITLTNGQLELSAGKETITGP